MLNGIIDWSIQNRFFVILATIGIIFWGVYAVESTPLDAIPDLSDVQVIIYTDFPGQAPQVVEDQVTYPITTQMLAVPYAKVVRGYSFFGFSFVYVIFEDGTDMYWARSRVLEYLNYVSGRLPRGVTPSLGPDATGVGWAFMYALKSTERNLADLRSIQDWFLKYELTSVEGVSEVASIGGFVKQYQITVDPNKLRAYNISISKIRAAVERSNNDVGGRVLEMAETEFMIRGRGYIQNPEDVKQVVVGVDERGIPILLKDVATVQMGPEIRRGLAELNGQGEVVGGIIVIRFGANAYEVIQNVKEKLAQLKQGLPEDVEIMTVYDRSTLIERSVRTLIEKLLEEGLAVALVCILFLLHFRSSLVAVITLPIAVLIAFVIMYYQGINWCHGRCSDHHDRECPQTPRTRSRQEGSLADYCRRFQGSGTYLVLCPLGHHRLLCSGFYAGRARRTIVQAAGVHENLLHGRCVNSGGNYRTGTDGLLDPGEDPFRKEESH
jgi:Cu(I)/Ag(I) efflux system membrane protein CusA/SilA